MNASVSAWRRAARSSGSCSLTFKARASRAVVQRARSGQGPQAAPNVAVPLGLIVRVRPLGQVTVRVVWSMVKSSAVKPPGTGARSGIGLMIA